MGGDHREDLGGQAGQAVVEGLLVQGEEEDRGVGVPPWGQVVVVARVQQTLKQLVVAVGEERLVLEAEVGGPQQVVVMLLVRTQAEEAQQKSIPGCP